MGTTKFVEVIIKCMVLKLVGRPTSYHFSLVCMNGQVTHGCVNVKWFLIFLKLSRTKGGKYK